MTRRPVPARITEALDLAELYGPEVDLALGVREPAVDLWEAGRLVPTTAQVERLAVLTGRPLEFFYLEMSPVVGWMCRRSGPRKDRCTRIDTRPTADVAPIDGQLTLFGGHNP